MRRGNDEGLIFNLKLDISAFDRRMDANEFLDWLNMMEHVFEYYDHPHPRPHKNVKLVAIKMYKNAFTWCKNLKNVNEMVKRRLKLGKI